MLENYFMKKMQTTERNISSRNVLFDLAIEAYKESLTEQPVELSLETIKQFATDPKVHDAVRNPTNPFSMAWHKREEEHRREVGGLRAMVADLRLHPRSSPERESGSDWLKGPIDTVAINDGMHFEVNNMVPIGEVWFTDKNDRVIGKIKNIGLSNDIEDE